MAAPIFHYLAIAYLIASHSLSGVRISTLRRGVIRTVLAAPQQSSRPGGCWLGAPFEALRRGGIRAEFPLSS